METLVAYAHHAKEPLIDPTSVAKVNKLTPTGIIDLSPNLPMRVSFLIYFYTNFFAGGKSHAYKRAFPLKKFVVSIFCVN